MYLFFDTETTGLPKNWKAPVTDVNNWPRLVQLAWHVYDEHGIKLCENDCIIKPVGFSIPVEASKIHRITTERALAEGLNLIDVLMRFEADVLKATTLVAHNMSFDEKIVGAELLRNNMSNCIASKAKLCTMERSTNYCKIPGPYGNKWPKLSELHVKLFNKNFEEAHNAAVDISATARCFWEMRRLGLL